MLDLLLRPDPDAGRDSIFNWRDNLKGQWTRTHVAAHASNRN